jgi:hypothetical protein
VQTVQIDKLGTAPFDGTTVLDPLAVPITVQTFSGESRTVISIPSGFAVGQINIGALLGIPSGNPFMIHDLSITGDFAGNFTGGSVQILGPPDPITISRPALTFPLVGTPGIHVPDGPRWLLPTFLLAITTLVGDTGPYRIVMLVEQNPNQKLAASVASGMLS